MEGVELENTERPRASVARNAGIVSLAVMASRVLVWCATKSSPRCSAPACNTTPFLTAFRVPNLLRDLFAEGALSAAFVTTFTSDLAKPRQRSSDSAVQPRRDPDRLSSSQSSPSSAWIFTPEIVRLLAPGFFAVPGKAELTIELTRIMMPFLLLIALAAQAMGMFNAFNVFGVPALASAFFNLGSIVGGLLIGFLHWPDRWLERHRRHGLWRCHRRLFAIRGAMAESARARFQLSGRHSSVSDPGVRQILRLMGPAIIGTAAVQINVFINTNFASAIIDPATGTIANGPVSWLNYAFRFMQFPIGVFGVAIATATLPTLSRSTANPDYREFRRTLAHSLTLVFLLCIPSAVGLAVLATPIVALVFEHGKFTASTPRKPPMPWPPTPSVLPVTARSKFFLRPSTRSTTRARRC